MRFHVFSSFASINVLYSIQVLHLSAFFVHFLLSSSLSLSVRGPCVWGATPWRQWWPINTRVQEPWQESRPASAVEDSRKTAWSVPRAPSLYFYSPTFFIQMKFLSYQVYADKSLIIGVQQCCDAAVMLYLCVCLCLSASSAVCKVSIKESC